MTSTTRSHHWLAGCGIVVAAAALGLGCADESAHPPMADVGQEWTCSAGPDGTLRASGAVTNHSSKPSFYLVTIEFTVDGVPFDTTTATVDDVGPGETARIESTVLHAPAGDPECVVSDVDRFKA
jgi:hypothetical protein